jgi:NADPH:quinone reductase-like Zn-dependent oxidoreductase
MKAAVATHYGSPDAIRIVDVPTPIPGTGEILIRVHATTVNRTDSGELTPGWIGRLLLYGFWRPRRAIFGFDVAGVVEQVGPKVTRFAPGDRVFGMCPIRRDGAHAQYVCMPEDGPITTLPAHVAFDHAVVCEGAYYASATMLRPDVGPGTRILVYGASGAIGSAAVQLAKDRGADVTAAVQARHLELARSLGADHVFDCASPGFARLGPCFDLVYDAVGKMPIRQWRRLRKRGGIFATTDIGPWGQSLLAWLVGKVVRSVRVEVPSPKRSGIGAFLAYLREMMAAGRYRAIIDRTYRLEEIADAYRYVATGQKAGIVVIDVAGGERPATG